MSARLFGAQMEKWIKEQAQVTEAVARGFAIEAFKRLLTFSPQYSGDFVMNWRISLNQPDRGGADFTDKSLLGPNALQVQGSPFKAGSMKAVSAAIRLNEGRLNDFRLRLDDKTPTTIVYFTNDSRHDEPYAWKIEDNQIIFRPGNEGAVVRRMFASMMADYGGGLTDQQVLSLRNKRMRFGNVK
jgi:hypothetical protein